MIDETFKANSAILNTLLTLMNERLFHNDGQPTPCPLVTLFGASNELPEGRELEALFDRFLLRYEVSYLLLDAARETSARVSALQARTAIPHLRVGNAIRIPLRA